MLQTHWDRAACYRDTLGQGQHATETHWDRAACYRDTLGQGQRATDTLGRAACYRDTLGQGQRATDTLGQGSLLQRHTRTRAACYRDTLGQGSVLHRHTRTRAACYRDTLGQGSVLQRCTVSHHWLDMVELNCSSDTPDTETSLVRHSPNVKDEARFVLGECKQFNSPLRHLYLDLHDPRAA